MAKLALVLSGGGSRGSYEIGVWQALRELQIEPDIVTGTSVGALNGAMVVQGDFDVALAMWQQLETQMVFDVDSPEEGSSQEKTAAVLESFAREFFRQGGAGTSALEGILREYISEERVRASDKQFGVVTVELPALKEKQMMLQDIPEGELHDYLLASAACFPAVQPHTIGETKYIDGGFADNLPAKLAQSCGADSYIVVDLEAVGKVDREFLATLSDLRVIRSHWGLGNFLLFDTSVAAQNIRQGYLDAMRSFERYDGFAYTFEKGSLSALAEERLRHAFRLTDRLGVTGAERNSANRLLLVRLLRTLRRYAEEKHLTPVAFLTSAAEIAARTLKVSPLTVYSDDTFHDAVFAAAADTPILLLAKQMVLAYEEGRAFPLIELLPLPAESLLASLYLAAVLSRRAEHIEGK